MTANASPAPVGYGWLLERFGVPALWTPRTSSLHAGAMREVHRPDGHVHVRYPPGYGPGETVVDHLVFALKHEGVDLRILRAVLSAMDPGELRDAVRAQPTSQ